VSFFIKFYKKSGWRTPHLFDIVECTTPHHTAPHRFADICTRFADAETRTWTWTWTRMRTWMVSRWMVSRRSGKVQRREFSFKETFFIFFYTNYLELPKG
jgi:hypothetical protein